jgi:hypothetical protein
MLPGATATGTRFVATVGKGCLSLLRSDAKSATVWWRIRQKHLPLGALETNSSWKQNHKDLIHTADMWWSVKL